MRQLILAIMSFVMACLCMSNMHGQTRGMRRAFVIGVDAYAHLAPLGQPGNDSEAMKGALEKAGFVVTTADDATQAAFAARFAEFVDSVQSTDVVFFYFAGHGAQISNVSYLLTRDFSGSAADLESHAIRVDSLIKKIESRHPKIKIFVLDACQTSLASAHVNSAIQSVDSSDYGPGTYIATSTTPQTAASDNGVFAEALISAMGLPHLGIDEVFMQVRKALENQQQIPHTTSTLSEPFYFTLATSGDCSNDSIESLRVEVKSRLIDQVRQNLQCRPENANDDQTQVAIGAMLENSSLQASQGFLNELWNTQMSTSFNYCTFGPYLAMQHNFDGLAWLFSKTPPNTIQDCEHFDGILIDELYKLNRVDAESTLKKLTSSGMSLAHNDYSLFRLTYERNIEIQLAPYQWLLTMTAPDTLAEFLEVRGRANSHIISTAPLFKQDNSDLGPFNSPQERSRQELLKFMSEYCPQGKPYCGNIHNPQPEIPISDTSRVKSGTFADSSTGLMWTTKASKDGMNWPAANLYCSDLSESNYHDWRLPKVDELLKLYDTSLTTTSTCKGPHGETLTFHTIKEIDPGCGDVWSGKKSSRVLDVGGYKVGYAWFVDFTNGGPKEDPAAWIANVDIYQHHTLCVRPSAGGPGAGVQADSNVTTQNASALALTQADAFTDTRTGLMWTRHDNGQGVTWSEAGAYCSNLKTGNFKDWRMPDDDELKTLYDPHGTQHPSCLQAKIRAEVCVSSWWVWSSTKGRDIAMPDWANGPEHTMKTFSFYDGTMRDNYRNQKVNTALCVRKSQ